MFDGRRNCFQDALPVGHHVVIVEAEYAVTPRCEERIAARIAARIAFEMLVLEMLPAVDLNHEVCGMADKVDNVRTDRRLPPEACAVQPVRAYCAPNDPFCICRILSQ